MANNMLKSTDTVSAVLQEPLLSASNMQKSPVSIKKQSNFCAQAEHEKSSPTRQIWDLITAKRNGKDQQQQSENKSQKEPDNINQKASENLLDYNTHTNRSNNSSLPTSCHHMNDECNNENVQTNTVQQSNDSQSHSKPNSQQLSLQRKQGKYRFWSSSEIQLLISEVLESPNNQDWGQISSQIKTKSEHDCELFYKHCVNKWGTFHIFINQFYDQCDGFESQNGETAEFQKEKVADQRSSNANIQKDAQLVENELNSCVPEPGKPHNCRQSHWSQSEQMLLLKLVQQKSPKLTWKEIAGKFKTRTFNSCWHQYKHMCGIQKSATIYNVKELRCFSVSLPLFEQKLEHMNNATGGRISSNIKQQDQQQCQNQKRNYEMWTDVEEAKLKQLKELKMNWPQISAEFMNKYSSSACSNHYSRLLRKELEQKCKSKQQTSTIIDGESQQTQSKIVNKENASSENLVRQQAEKLPNGQAQQESNNNDKQKNGSQQQIDKLMQCSSEQNSITRSEEAKKLQNGNETSEEQSSHQKWTKDEDAILVKLASEQNLSWKQIQMELKNKYTTSACKNRYARIQNKDWTKHKKISEKEENQCCQTSQNNTKIRQFSNQLKLKESNLAQNLSNLKQVRNWTEKQILSLYELRTKYHKCWREIAQILGNKSKSQVFHKYLSMKQKQQWDMQQNKCNKILNNLSILSSSERTDDEDNNKQSKVDVSLSVENQSQNSDEENQGKEQQTTSYKIQRNPQSQQHNIDEIEQVKDPSLQKINGCNILQNLESVRPKVESQNKLLASAIRQGTGYLWTISEYQTLINIVLGYGGKVIDWATVAAAVGRPLVQCHSLHGYRQHRHGTFQKFAELFNQVVKMFCFDRVQGVCFRILEQIYNRVTSGEGNKRNANEWSILEAQKLIAAVNCSMNESGYNWNKIAMQVSSKSEKQCQSFVEQYSQKYKSFPAFAGLFNNLISFFSFENIQDIQLNFVIDVSCKLQQLIDSSEQPTERGQNQQNQVQITQHESNMLSDIMPNEILQNQSKQTNKTIFKKNELQFDENKPKDSMPGLEEIDNSTLTEKPILFTNNVDIPKEKQKQIEQHIDQADNSQNNLQIQVDKLKTKEVSSICNDEGIAIPQTLQIIGVIVKNKQIYFQTNSEYGDVSYSSQSISSINDQIQRNKQLRKDLYKQVIMLDQVEQFDEAGIKLKSKYYSQQVAQSDPANDPLNDPVEVSIQYSHLQVDQQLTSEKEQNLGEQGCFPQKVEVVQNKEAGDLKTADLVTNSKQQYINQDHDIEKTNTQETQQHEQPNDQNIKIQQKYSNLKQAYEQLNAQVASQLLEFNADSFSEEQMAQMQQNLKKLDLNKKLLESMKQFIKISSSK